jgi:predicted acyltransferase
LKDQNKKDLNKIVREEISGKLYLERPNTLFVMSNPTEVVADRLLSLDFFRGLAMFLLIVEFSHLFTYLVSPDLEGTALYWLGTQFHHVEWVGLRFWDLIQPFFMFIVGVAMPLSFAKRREKGAREDQIRRHVFQRAFLMLLIGWWLYCIDPGKIVFRFQNVIAQLGVTYLLAYAVMKKQSWAQIAFSVLLLLITECIYRFFPLEGFDRAFVAGENFGAWLNILIAGSEDGGHWAMFNAIPTAAHTIWGVLAGQLLMSERSDWRKVRQLVLAGIIALVIGYGLSYFTPIIKRISTSTFVLVSGGYCLLALALSYWWIDILKRRRGVWIMTIVGMNPLFIYLFSHIGGADLLRKIIAPITYELSFLIGDLPAGIVLSLATLWLLWGLCYFLYKRRIFIRI